MGSTPLLSVPVLSAIEGVESVESNSLLLTPYCGKMVKINNQITLSSGDIYV
jgi:hypothetical protein